MEEKVYRSFTDLEVWQIARQFKKDMSMIVADYFPHEEKYRLADQLIRASRSIGSNIAEGYGRFTYKDQLHFCVQAGGSISECINHLFDALDCTYITEEKFGECKRKAEEVEKRLNGFIAWLRKKAAEPK
jgi:four helix bundle protein